MRRRPDECRFGTSAGGRSCSTTNTNTDRQFAQTPVRVPGKIDAGVQFCARARRQGPFCVLSLCLSGCSPPSRMDVPARPKLRTAYASSNVHVLTLCLTSFIRPGSRKQGSSRPCTLPALLLSPRMAHG